MLDPANTVTVCPAVELVRWNCTVPGVDPFAIVPLTSLVMIVVLPLEVIAAVWAEAENAVSLLWVWAEAEVDRYHRTLTRVGLPGPLTPNRGPLVDVP